MISTSQTNFLYLTDTLPIKYPDFFHRFEKLLKEYKVDYKLLPGTKDVWARDYMPIQVRNDRFIRFVYKPDYLKSEEEMATKSDTDTICKQIDIGTIKSEIVLDGGNVINNANRVIMTEKIFEENPLYEREDLVRELKRIFDTDELFFIPQHPDDFTGHADGMVQSIDDNTILINNYKDEYTSFKKGFDIAIQKMGLEYIQIPYNPYENDKDKQANGIYINYLEMENLIIIPIFGIGEDTEVIKQFKNIFPEKPIASIDSNDIAKEGGILNCISWTIDSTYNLIGRRNNR